MEQALKLERGLPAPPTPQPEGSTEGMVQLLGFLSDLPPSLATLDKTIIWLILQMGRLSPERGSDLPRIT